MAIIPSSLTPQHFPASRLITVYMLLSVGMTVGNKRAVGSLHAGTVLLAAQLGTTCLFVALLSLFRVTTVQGSLSACIRWTPTGIISGLLLWAGMGALKRASLSTLTVVRNMSPLFLLIAEWLAFGVRPSRGTAGSLVLILIGVVIYTWDDLQEAHADFGGILFISLDAFLVCVDSLYERYMLAIRPIQLSTGALVLITNGVGLLPVAVLLVGPCANEWQELSLSMEGLLWGFATLPGGLAIAYAGVFLRCVVSATTAVVVANVDKVLVLGYGVFFMGDRMDAVKGVGCTFALLGGAWHAWARTVAIQPRERQSCSSVETCLAVRAESNEPPDRSHH